MSRLMLAMTTVVTLGLAGCGYSQGDRALSGGALGAAGGAAVGAIAGGGPGALAGGLIGGAGGAAAGALTSPRDVNLGRPSWK